MGAMLELHNFQYSYGNIKVVKGIDLYVNEGEMVTLIGANGAGKTTTLRTISGLTEARGVEGEIIFNGNRIEGMKGSRIARMGLVQVLEGRHIFSKLTVEENLLNGAYTRRDTKGIEADLQKIYKRFPRLLERKQQMGGTLSGGEQQMLAIGRALIANPRMILLDEPSLGLAPLIVAEIFEAIREINREGTTVLFVEQNSKIALTTAQRGYVLQTGHMILTDTCESLLHNEDVRKAYLGEE
ncbi:MULTISPECIES: ABC transporter ATP-binding protein [Enterocloster]|uniref:Amino acid/amide ABC transporter ATP-binding protein 2, HAAT family n=1 Tax=Enterocloster lavalensis TaxID=460384 RepID=A0A1I0HKC2_9FIRM|nr:ABC transporter ATP-binding protein [Enterocloster sp.]MDR3757387.1 ABC transporter ATP-binding protein [Enterocloster sp.]SET84323.1 amino acid/amide ABC transporter ATP-binding protein 2, HAAT family [Enterocloster lavalensis]